MRRHAIFLDAHWLRQELSVEGAYFCARIFAVSPGHSVILFDAEWPNSDCIARMYRLIWALDGHTFYLKILSWQCWNNETFLTVYEWIFINSKKMVKLREWIHLVEFLPFLQREITIMTFLLFLQQAPLIVGSTRKGNTLLFESKFFSLRVDPCWQGRQDHSGRIASLTRLSNCHHKANLKMSKKILTLVYPMQLFQERSFT